MTTTLPRPDVISGPVRSTVDELFLTDPVAAFRAIDAATADPSESVREWELDATGRTVWEAGYMIGFAAAGTELHTGIQTLRAQLERAQHDADRYYAEMCRRPAVREPDRASFAELSRRRGEHETAARAERQAAALAAAMRVAA